MKVVSGLLFFLILVVVGTAVFKISGDMSVVDALYLTVVSSSTVGYGASLCVVAIAFRKETGPIRVGWWIRNIVLMNRLTLGEISILRCCGEVVSVAWRGLKGVTSFYNWSSPGSVAGDRRDPP